MTARRTTLSAVGLPVLITAAAVALLAITHALLASRIAEAAHARELAQLRTVLADVAFDNDPIDDQQPVIDARLGPGAQVAHPVRRHGVLQAQVVTATAPDGYGGPIQLLIGIAGDGRVLGVRVLSHRETPGLGDAFAQPGNDWLDAFIGRSLASPSAARWRVRRDGGDIDQFTGATVTPRAIVQAVQRALAWHADATHTSTQTQTQTPP